MDDNHMQKAVKVKDEMCLGCLSSDRSLSVVSANSDLFMLLLERNDNDTMDPVDISLCWECSATLRSTRRFQQRIQRAQDVMRSRIYHEGLTSLSTLTKYNLQSFSSTDTEPCYNIHEENNPPNSHEIKYRECYVLLERIELKVENKSDSETDIDDDDLDTGVNEIEENLDYKIKTEQQSYNCSEDMIGEDEEVDRYNEGNCSSDQEMESSFCELMRRHRPNKHDDSDKRIEERTEATKQAREHPLTDEGKAIKTCNIAASPTKTTKLVKINETIKQNNGLNCFKSIKLAPTNVSKPNYISRYFACDSCSFVTSVKDQLIKHMKTHKQCLCETCGLRFDNTNDLNKHLLVHAGKMFYCNVCDKIFINRQSFYFHLKKHGGKPHICEICDERFSRIMLLKRHLRIHTHTDVQAYSCKMCNKKFSKKTLLKFHHKVHTKPYSCKICAKKFSRKALLEAHCKAHSGEKPFSCEICNKKFSQSYYLASHMKRVHKLGPRGRFESLQTNKNNEKVHTCEICSKSFNCKSNYERHLVVHKDERPYRCEICDKRFKCKGSFKYHQIVHTNEKPYICNTCGVKFAFRNLLVQHERTHTGERPFSCQICDKKYTTKRILTFHLRTHNSEKLYSCDTCGVRFKEKEYLKRHLRSINHRCVLKDEKSYKCETCARIFKSKDGLTKHRSEHTGEKPFSCELCDKKFSRSIYLRLHQHVHTGEKRYSCEMCDKRYGRPEGLQRHQIKVHTNPSES